jgi:hypothetical protein
MATSVLENALILHGDSNTARDLTCQANTVGIDFGAETQDNTALCDTTRSNQGALKTAGFSAEGFFDSDMDAALFDDVGVNGTIVTAANGKDVGERSFSLVAVAGSYQPVGGSVGELNSFTLNASARGDLERGYVLFHSESETATGTGTTFQAGSAVTSLVAILYVFSASGSNPTLDVTVESDTADDFTGAEVTRATFTQATARTAERVVGTATSDTWYRVSYTIGGTNPDVGFAVLLIPTA